jgi:hypothetical protein
MLSGNFAFGTAPPHEQLGNTGGSKTADKYCNNWNNLVRNKSISTPLNRTNNFFVGVNAGNLTNSETGYSVTLIL